MFFPPLPLADSSRLYSAAIARLTPLTMVATGSVIFKLLGAILDLDASAAAEVFIIGAFVRVLESTPAADVVDEDRP